MSEDNIPTEILLLADESATLAYGAALAAVLKSHNPPWIVFLKGDLGAGKTTLVRGFLKAMGYQGVVKSPTYTLVESYPCILDHHDASCNFLQNGTFYHFDLYRLEDPKRLDLIGMQDYGKDPGMVWIEWPEQGAGFLPDPDLMIELKVVPEGRTINIQRVSLRAQTLKVPKV